jgi:hypothetical protein
MPHHALLLPAISLGLGVSAQEPAWHWARSAGGVYTDYASAVSTDAQGNAYVAGTFYSTAITLGDTTLLNQEEEGGYADLYVAKYNPNGEMLWVRQGTGPQSQLDGCVATDAEGNVFVSGAHYGSITLGPYTFNSAGAYDVFLAKYAADGTLLWATSAGSAASDAPTDLAFDGDGGVVLTGSFSGQSIQFGSTVLQNVNAEYSDAFLVRYDANGNVLWARSAGSVLADRGRGVATDAAGNVLLAGYFQGATLHIGTSELDNAGANTSDVFLAKYDPEGNLLWALNAGGERHEEPRDLAVDGHDDILLCGQFNGPTLGIGGEELTNSTGEADFYDVFLAKYHGDGTPLWARSGGGEGNDDAWALAIDGEDHAVLVGYGESAGCTYGPFSWTASPLGDAMALKYAPDGEELWAVHAGGDNIDQFIGTAIDPNGDVWLAGAIGSDEMTIGNTVLTNAGTTDMMLLKLDGTATGLAEPPPTAGVTLYPVPSSGRVTLTSPVPMRQLLMRDATGRIVYRASPKSQQAELELHIPGVYIAEMSLGNATLTKRLVICE